MNRGEPVVIHISGKRVFVFEEHHYAMIPWGSFRSELPAAPRLFTLDLHTDTKRGFGVAAAVDAAKSGGLSSLLDIENAMISSIRANDPASLECAVSRLRYDEHIDAALRSGILDIAFVAAHEGISLSSNEELAARARREKARADLIRGDLSASQYLNEREKQPFTYSLPLDRIVILPEAKLKGVDRGRGRDNRKYKDAAIENKLLEKHLRFIDDFCASAKLPGLFDRPFVLDIDLDYFNTRASVSPQRKSLFYKLIREAGIITIARESTCVQDLQIEGEGLTSDYLADKLLSHIARALK